MLADDGKGGLNPNPGRDRQGFRGGVHGEAYRHGARGSNCGGWCFDEFRRVFAARGFTCHAPDLIGHGADKATAKGTLASVGIADYRSQMATFVKALPERPVVLGHSMGAIIAQQLAA